MNKPIKFKRFMDTIVMSDNQRKAEATIRLYHGNEVKTDVINTNLDDAVDKYGELEVICLLNYNGFSQNHNFQITLNAVDF